MKKLIKNLKKEKRNILIGIISLILLLIGSVTVGFLPSLILIVIVDILIILLTSKKKTTSKEKWKSFLIVGFCCATFFLILGICFVMFIVATAPNFSPEKLYNRESSILYNKNGEEFAKLGTEVRKKITYDQLSESLIDAIIATEDARYFQHSGVDLPRFIKASVSQLMGQGGGGASTLTMQVSKQTQTSTEAEGIKGIIRKFTDIYMAVFQIETRYTKEEILEFYVNSNCLGSNNYGVEQASLAYFGKSASELNISESALIAGMFQAPNAYYPFKYPKECEKRRKTVLALMLRHGYINQKEYDIALELTVDKLLNTSSSSSNAPEYQDFIDTVVDEVITRTGFSPYEMSMKIYTTMDADMQKNMNKVMKGENFKWPDENIQGGSAVIDVKTGAIVAIGGGHNRKSGDFNYATQTNRQIGSTAKPLYDYGPGIEYNNWSTYTSFTDEPYAYSSGMAIKNWDRKYFGLTSLHDALKYSRNIPAVKAFQKVDNKKIEQFVKNLGLSPEANLYEAHSIGGYTGESPLSVAAAYAAFSNKGYYNEPYSFTSLVYNDSGKDYTVKATKRKVMSEQTAYMITKVLEDTSSYAVGLSVNGVNYASKTGSTNLDSEDVKKLGINGSVNDKWIASYNDSYSIATWIGYQKNSKDTYKVNSFNSIKTLFQSIAKGVYKKKSTWEQPNDVVLLEVEEGLQEVKLPSPFTPDNLKVKAYFKKGFEPTEVSARFSQLDNITNLSYNEQTSSLTWNKIATPKFSDENYLSSLASSMFTNEGSRQEYLNSMINHKNNTMGKIVYKIYTKDSSGALTLVGETDNNTFTHKANGSITYVVKTSYSIFTSNMSSGSEISITATIPSVITSELNGKDLIELNVGDKYEEPTNPIIILENGTTNVTNKAKITVSVKRNSDNVVYDSLIYILTTSPESYTITYKISYQDYETTLTKIVTVK